MILKPKKPKALIKIFKKLRKDFKLTKLKNAKKMDFSLM